jgi:L-iditol 2-dehydrogenase
LLKVGGVGLCGTDFHIFEGHANYHTDAQGRPIPLSEQAQIMGHEFCGTVVELGSAVSDLKVGDRVVVDQGLNCSAATVEELCEYLRDRQFSSVRPVRRVRHHWLTGSSG